MKVALRGRESPFLDLGRSPPDPIKVQRGDKSDTPLWEGSAYMYIDSKDSHAFSAYKSKDSKI